MKITSILYYHPVFDELRERVRVQKKLPGPPLYVMVGDKLMSRWAATMKTHRALGWIKIGRV